MSNYVEKALAEINKCQHFAIRELANSMDTDERILYVGMIAERINKIERPKNINQRIRELREAKGL